METDAIVNTANPKVRVGDGIDRAVYEAAGEDELLSQIKTLVEELRPRRANALRLAQRVLREPLRQVVLFHHGLHVVQGREPLHERKLLFPLPQILITFIFHARIIP